MTFVHGFPQVCISLGFAVDRIPVVGVVFNPFSQSLYTAIRGQGAFLNRKTKLPLKGSHLEALRGLDSSLIAIEWGSEREGQNWDVKVRTFQKLCQSKEAGGAMVNSLRSSGSAALNFCSLSTGLFVPWVQVIRKLGLIAIPGCIDLYWEGGCFEWDVCAGWVILVEAGGVRTYS